MFSTELTAAKHLQGCSLVRRDFVVEVSVTYTNGLLECVANKGTRWCHSVYCCRSQWCLGLSLVDYTLLC